MNRFIEFLKKIWYYILKLFGREVPTQTKTPSNTSEGYLPFLPQNLSKKDLKEINKVLEDNKKHENPIGKVSTYQDINVIRESFPSISNLLYTLRHRSHNVVMIGRNNSNAREHNGFFKTDNYHEAEYLLSHGWDAILSKLNTYKKKVDELSTNYVKGYSYPTNEIYGYVPNIPRAIQCLPNNMIYRPVVPKKHKTVDLIYDTGANCTVKSDEFINAGIAILSAINLIEMSGIRVRLRGIVYSGMDGMGRNSNSSEIAIGDVLLKDFSERLNILKLCFPLAHPSMLRRIGFRFLETTPYLTSRGFIFGYGSSISTKHEQDIIKNESGTLITMEIIRSLDYDVEKLINYIKDAQKQD